MGRCSSELLLTLDLRPKDVDGDGKPGLSAHVTKPVYGGYAFAGQKGRTKDDGTFHALLFASCESPGVRAECRWSAQGRRGFQPAYSSDVLATTQESTNASSDQAFERQYPQTGYPLVQGPSSYITAYFGSRVLRLSLPMILCKPNGAGLMTVAYESLIQFQRHLSFVICHLPFVVVPIDLQESPG